eukprot:2282592-Pleurochrysis_carterae.AAC.3
MTDAVRTDNTREWEYQVGGIGLVTFGGPTAFGFRPPETFGVGRMLTPKRCEQFAERALRRSNQDRSVVGYESGNVGHWPFLCVTLVKDNRRSLRAALIGMLQHVLGAGGVSYSQQTGRATHIFVRLSQNSRAC